MGILTHCNAGTIATAKYGTALAPLYLGAEKGYNFKVFADETRPLLQGARLTAWELNEAGIDVTLICDNMASIVMKNGWIDAVVVGCDRVTYNPAFDVTDAKYITAIITEKGIAYPPYEESLPKLFDK